eukprot:jgi/Tetstr1/454239/TSEL_041158.t1
MIRSAWLQRALSGEGEGAGAGGGGGGGGGAGAGGETIRGNGARKVCVASLLVACVEQAGCDSWSFRTLYAPLRLLRRHPLRAEKYFWATVSSVRMVEMAFGGTVTQTRHLHRHAVLTCYLDALVDASDDLAWPLAFGLAVFGLRPHPPDFLPSQDAAMRADLRHDYPRLRLAAAGEHRDLIVGSLLDAAKVEGQRCLVPHLEHKLLSNLMCIRPFLVAGGLVDPDLMEPLAMVYTFFDDALDVLEDRDAGVVGAHLSDEAGIARGAALARRAISELNARSALDWSGLGQAAVAVAAAAAREQVMRPERYREIEAGVCTLCVHLVLTVSVALRALRRPRAG